MRTAFRRERAEDDMLVIGLEAVECEKCVAYLSADVVTETCVACLNTSVPMVTTMTAPTLMPPAPT